MVSIILLLVATLLAAWLIPALFEHVRKVLILAKLPQFNTHWLLGVAETFARPHKVHKLDVETMKSHGPIVTCRLLHVHMVVVYDPMIAHKVASRELQASKPQTYDGFNTLTGFKGYKNLVTMATDDVNWKIARKGLAPAFAQKNIKHAFDVVRDTALQLCDVLRNKGSEVYVDMDNYAMRETIDIIGKWGFRVDLGALQGKNALMPELDVLAIMHVILNEVNKQIFTPLRNKLYKWLPGGAKVHHCFELFHKMEYLLVQKAREMHAAGATKHIIATHMRLAAPGPHQPFLLYTLHRMQLILMHRAWHTLSGKLDEESLAARLLQLKDVNGVPWTDDALAPQAGMVLFAAHDTTGHTIAYTLYFISQHPEVEKKLTEELAQHGLLQTPQNPNPRPLQYKDLHELKYLQCVVKESMRLLPVLPAIARQFKHDVKIEGYLLPRNTPIVISQYSIHTCFWADGNAFKPERWLEEHADYYVPELHNAQKVLPKGAYTAKNPPVGVHTNASTPSAQGKTRQSVSNWLFSGDSEEVAGSALGPKRFTPFSEGPRDCIGQSLAKISVPTTIAVLLSRFTFKLEPNFDVDTLDWLAGTMRPEGGLPLRCIPRV